MNFNPISVTGKINSFQEMNKVKESYELFRR